MLLSCTLKVDGEHAGSVASFTLPSSRERFLVGCGSGCSLVTEQYETPGGGGGTLGICGWGCAAGTLKPLTYTRASSAEFCYPILE